MTHVKRVEWEKERAERNNQEAIVLPGGTGMDFDVTGVSSAYPQKEPNPSKVIYPQRKAQAIGARVGVRAGIGPRAKPEKCCEPI